VDAVVVAAGDGSAVLPADNFAVSGDALVSAMGRGEVRREARQQERADATPSRRPAREPSASRGQSRMRSNADQAIIGAQGGDGPRTGTPSPLEAGLRAFHAGWPAAFSFAPGIGRAMTGRDEPLVRESAHHHLRAYVGACPRA
jgi:hypothetical protein